MMRRSNLYPFLETGAAIVGTGAAFAFLEAGAFRGIGVGTLQRMIEPGALHSAAIGAGATTVLMVPYILWKMRQRS